jgi:hypothetical protein
LIDQREIGEPGFISAEIAGREAIVITARMEQAGYRILVTNYTGLSGRPQGLA